MARHQRTMRDAALWLSALCLLHAVHQAQAQGAHRGHAHASSDFLVKGQGRDGDTYVETTRETLGEGVMDATTGVLPPPRARAIAPRNRAPGLTPHTNTSRRCGRGRALRAVVLAAVVERGQLRARREGAEESRRGDGLAQQPRRRQGGAAGQRRLRLRARDHRRARRRARRRQDGRARDAWCAPAEA